MADGRVKELFENQEIIALGTADKNGVPNVVPVYWKKMISDKIILFADNYMKKTKENILTNPNVCVSFWDASKNIGYKLIGKIKYHTEGNVFKKGIEWVKSINPAKEPKGILEFEVNEIYDICPGLNAGKHIE